MEAFGLEMDLTLDQWQRNVVPARLVPRSAPCTRSMGAELCRISSAGPFAGPAAAPWLSHATCRIWPREQLGSLQSTELQSGSGPLLGASLRCCCMLFPIFRKKAERGKIQEDFLGIFVQGYLHLKLPKAHSIPAQAPRHAQPTLDAAVALLDRHRDGLERGQAHGVVEGDDAPACSKSCHGVFDTAKKEVQFFF